MARKEASRGAGRLAARARSRRIAVEPSIRVTWSHSPHHGGWPSRAVHIAADYTVGVLTLTIPVHEAAKPRSIQITSHDAKQQVTAGT